jgi:hypothetical protein
VAELLGRAPPQLRPWAQWWALDYDVTRLDAFAALGDEPAVNAEVAPLLGTSPFLDAVAWRALGTVRRDPALRQRAVDAFLQMGLPGQAAVVFHRGLSSRPAARAEQRRRSPAPGGS